MLALLFLRLAAYYRDFIMRAPNIAWAGFLTLSRRTVQRPENDPAALVLEAWSQGLMTGSLVIMAAVTFANMRRGVLLHKLILLEVTPSSINLNSTC